MKIFAVRTIALFLVVFGLSNEMSGQFVTIPDANFRAKLQLIFPACFNGNGEMDTTCTQIINAQGLFLAGLGIANLEGLQYFDNLGALSCQNNSIVNLPVLPPSLVSLYCFNNDILSLPPLPSGLQILHCGMNNITSLPALPNTLFSLLAFQNSLSSLPPLPAGLIMLHVDNNNLLSIPPLPGGLIELHCAANYHLDSIPLFPPLLTRISCGSCSLAEIPSLPPNLQVLSCGANTAIDSLPPLPSTLIDLSTPDNSITQLPTLPIGLRNLNCANNPINGLLPLPAGLDSFAMGGANNFPVPILPNGLTFYECRDCGTRPLPTFPNGLEDLSIVFSEYSTIPPPPNSLLRLYVYRNNLTELPPLPPNLSELQAGNNNLSCLPILPPTLALLLLASNPITCLPNIPPNCASCHTFPLCQDPAQICPGSAYCEGNAFFDLNNDGVLNNGEVPTGNFVVAATPGNHATATTATGYRIELDSQATNTVEFINPYPLSLNIVPPTHQAVSNGPSQVPGNYDFALQYIPNVRDMEVFMTSKIARRGFNTAVDIRVSNVGTLPDTPVLALRFPHDWVPQLINPLGTHAGDSITWQCPPINPFESADFYVRFYIPVFVPLGQPFSYTAYVNDANDVTPNNNTYTINDVIIGSYDPNDKACNKTQLNPGYDPNEELVYTVRFQNTGNDTAFTVVVRDTLSPFLQANTVRVVNSSHDVDMHFIDNSHVLTFVFPNILLVDSFANEPLSHGFIQFAAKPQPNLPIGTTIENTADIYFDFNAPVRTNTVETNIGIVSVPSLASNTDLKIYPNPTNGRVRIETPEPTMDGSNVVISDMMGRTCLTAPCIGSSADISMENLPAGVYATSVVSEGRVLYRGLIVRK